MKYIVLLVCCFVGLGVYAQPFSPADSLRGGLTTFRTCFDVTYYRLDLRIEPDLHRIAGSNTVIFNAITDFSSFHLDLYPEMDIHQIEWRGKRLEYRRREGAVFVIFPEMIREGTKDSVKVTFAGSPVIAKNAPWDGGFVWTQSNGKPWVTVACEGEGASLWWPCKDHHSDEPDSLSISIIVPDNLVAVANGELKKTESLIGNLKRFTWKVSYPINLYNVSLYVGDYKHLTDFYQNASGKHKIDYYVLSKNTEKASAHFAQVKPMLACFEKYFGEYPFWNDGYAIVETPYWGMEHQGAIAYGNHFQNGNWGFDFIIIHESAHEWFGNSISMEDKSDMWIHEAFATYAEVVYVEEMYGKEKATEYLNEIKSKIQNKSVILAPRGVYYNHWEDADMYFKGAWMLHTLRIATGDDKKWFATLKKFCETYKIKIVNTKEVIRFFNHELGKDYSWLFDEYLRNTEIPELQYKIKRAKKTITVEYRWNAKTEGFSLPVDIKSAKGQEVIFPEDQWNSIQFQQSKDFKIIFLTQNGLFTVKELTGN